MIGIGAGLSFLATPLGRVLGAGVIGLGLLGYGYVKGGADARARCDADALRSQIVALERDLDIARAAAANEERLRTAAAEREKTLQERLMDYVEATDAPDVCAFTDTDVERLRQLTR